MNNFEEIQKVIDDLQDEVMADTTTQYKKALDESRNILRKYADKYGSLEEEVLRKNNAVIKLENELAAQAETLRFSIAGEIKNAMRDTYLTTFDETSTIINNIVDNRFQGLASSEMIEQTIEEEINGMTLSERLGKNKDRFVKDVMTTTEQGLKKGDTYSTMSKKLQERYEVDINSANRVVRTESHRIMEASKDETMQQANKQGIETLKFWITSQDERVRSSHRSIGAKYSEENAIPVDEPFLWSGMETMYPGNFPGAPSENINCRCITGYIIR